MKTPFGRDGFKAVSFLFAHKADKPVLYKKTKEYIVGKW
jgi:hypothetical protein